MADQRSVMVLTRPEPFARAFLEQCEALMGQKIDAIVSPVFEIVPVISEIDLDEFATLILTSRNAVAQIGTDLKGRRVATVGRRTAEEAQRYGADAMFLGETVDLFLESAGSVLPPAVHLRGHHTRGDLAARLSGIGIACEDCVVYDQVELPLSEDAQAALRSGHAVVPVFSPRTAELVSNYDTHPETQVLAISEAAAGSWKAGGRVRVASHPDGESMCALVQDALSPSSC